MKILKLLTLFLTLFVGTVSAQTPLKLAFLSSDGNVSSIEAKSLTLSVSGDNLVAANGEETLDLKLQSLVKMYFTGDEAGVELISVNLSDGTVSAYALDGKFAGKFESMSKALSELRAGIYIIKMSDNKSVKIVVQ